MTQDLEPSGTNTHQKLDERTFEELFRSHFKSLSIAAIQYVKDADLARDIVQEAFFNLWQKRDTIDLSRPVKNYLSLSVKNRCLNYIRDHRKFNDSEIEPELEDDHPEYLPSDRLALADLEKMISRSLEELPEKCREVFELSRYQHLKYQQIADKLSISVKTVETQMSKALKHMRERLSEFMPFILLVISTFSG